MSFHFEFVSPERLLFSGEVDSVILAGTEGEMTILAGFAPTMVALKPGIMSIADGKSNSAKRIFIREGFAEVSPSGLTVLAAVAIPVEELTSAKIDNEINQLDTLRDKSTDAKERQKLDERWTQIQEIRTQLQL